MSRSASIYDYAICVGSRVRLLSASFGLPLANICRRSILGPSLGGALAQPCVSYPNWFPRGTIFERFPYLLPNLVCASVVIFGVLVGFLFLEETHPEKRYDRDRGLELGDRILSFFGSNDRVQSGRSEKAAEAQLLAETEPLIDQHEPLPGYESTEGSPQMSLPAPPEVLEILDLNDNGFEPQQEKPIAKKAFTKQVVLNIVGYGVLA